jgi:hypothetical protein
MTMYTSLNAMQIRDSLADRLRGCNNDWRCKLWKKIIALYNSLRQKYDKE